MSAVRWLVTVFAATLLVAAPMAGGWLAGAPLDPTPGLALAQEDDEENDCVDTCYEAQDACVDEQCSGDLTEEQAVECEDRCAEAREECEESCDDE